MFLVHGRLRAALSVGALLMLVTACPAADDDDSAVAVDDDDVADDDDLADDDDAVDDDDVVDDDDSSTETCWLESDPQVDEWTPDYVPNTDCTCTAGEPQCHSIYVGRTVGLDGNLADLEFVKTDGGGPVVDASYWVVVGEALEPSCVDLAAFVTRAEGTWTAGLAPLAVAGVPVWPDAAAFAAAPEGDTRRLFVITGGSDGPTARTWFQRQALEFTKVCGDSPGDDDDAVDDDDAMDDDDAVDDDDSAAGVPVVSSVSPLTATLNTPTTFTVEGTSLPSTLALWIAECEGLTGLTAGPTEATFECSPSYTTGDKDGVVKDEPGGTELFSFTLTVTN
jgi:hypothetical protein